MLQHHQLDVRRIDVLAARQDHVLLAVDEIEKALIIEAADVAGAQPTTSRRIGPRGLERGVGPVVIALHHEPAIAADLAEFARPGLAIVVTHELELLARNGLADGLDLLVEVFGRQRRDDALGQPVEFDQLAVERVTSCALQRRWQRRAATHDGLQRREVAALSSGSSMSRWSCTGTKPPWVTRQRAMVSASPAGVNAGTSTIVPPARIVHNIVTQLMFEYSPSEQTVTAPL